MNEWHEDIKRILRKSTETEQHGVFLFTDTQVTNGINQKSQPKIVFKACLYVLVCLDQRRIVFRRCK